MKVLIDKKFLKELAKIPSAQRKKIENFVFVELSSVSSVSEIGSAENLKALTVIIR